MPVGEDELREHLAAIGERRARIRSASEQLQEDTRRAVQHARGRVPMIEVARLVGLDRTSLYQTYVDA